MTQKIAVAIIHGIGNNNPPFKDPQQPDEFTGGMAKELKSQFAKLTGEVLDREDPELEIEAVYWADVLQDLQDELYKRLNLNRLGYRSIREFVFNSLADSIGYQITSAAPPEDRTIYDAVHDCFSRALNELSKRAGTQAPLCVIAHSLGAAIACNYIWDLQSANVKLIDDNPLERGETLTLLYTLGNQIPFWSLRYKDFGTPVKIPSPTLSQYYPGLMGEWVNYYDKDDVLGYPIKHLNQKYEQVVKEDREVNVGGVFESWNPLSHNGYWTSDQVTKPIAQALFDLWQQVNA